MALSLRRDVKTGKFVQRGGTLSERGYRMGQAYFEVAAYSCSPPCACDGFEVCLHHVEKGPVGGGSSGPVWPILSCRTEEEAREVMKQVIAFARTIEPGDIHDHYDRNINGDTRLAAWLTEQGYSRRRGPVWAKETS